MAVDRAPGRAFARQQRRRSIQHLDAIEIERIHRASGHGRRADPDAVVERVDPVAAESAHRAAGGRAGWIGRGDADHGFRRVRRGADTAIAQGLAIDDLDRRRCLPRRQAEPACAVGDRIGVQWRRRRLRRSRPRRRLRRRGGTVSRLSGPLGVSRQPDLDRRAGAGLAGETTMRSSSCSAGVRDSGAACPRGAKATRPSAINEKENQCLETGDSAKLPRSSDVARHPGILKEDTLLSDGGRPVRHRIAARPALP
jgi:hypothetical protein